MTEGNVFTLSSIVGGGGGGGRVHAGGLSCVETINADCDVILSHSPLFNEAKVSPERL